MWLMRRWLRTGTMGKSGCRLAFFWWADVWPAGLMFGVLACVWGRQHHPYRRVHCGIGKADTRGVLVHDASRR